MGRHDMCLDVCGFGLCQTPNGTVCLSDDSHCAHWIDRNSCTSQWMSLVYLVAIVRAGIACVCCIAKAQPASPESSSGAERARLIIVESADDAPNGSEA